MERHNGIELDPEGAFVYYDDAQATGEALQANRCETCGAQVKDYIGGCPVCSAPQCCPMCCREATEEALSVKPSHNGGLTND